uniref:Uncharacterized protein n=1 Tax=Rhizophora mucronata TaxID=61149 RepID=A0A2P2R0X9_RHIMU
MLKFAKDCPLLTDN